MAKTQFPLMRSLRLTAVSRRLMLVLGAGSLALLCLLIHVFIPLPGLQTAALGLTGLALIATWATILCWRMPVFSSATLWIFTLIWFVGLGLAVVLVLSSAGSDDPLSMTMAVQWLAFSLSLSVGSLQFKALFNRRATPVLGRFASLLSPLAILILILMMSLRTT